MLLLIFQSCVRRLVFLMYTFLQRRATKRPTCCVLVMLKPAKGDLTAEELAKLKTDYEQVSDDIKELATSVI
ncbi:hypothetical protein AtNW77_Chr5g0091751 [Arabidopsis thaliana]